MLMPIPTPYIAAAAVPTIVHTANPTKGTSVSSLSPTGVSIGTADANRTVIVCAWLYSTSGGGGQQTISSVTIDGNSMTSLANVAVANTFCTASAVFAYNLASGTTADFVLTLSGAADFCALSVYAAYDLATPLTPADTVTGASTTLPIDSLWPDTVNGTTGPGIAIFAGAAANNNALALSDDFTGATLDRNEDLNTDDYCWCAAIAPSNCSSITLDGTITDTGINRSSSALVLLQ